MANPLSFSQTNQFRTAVEVALQLEAIAEQIRAGHFLVRSFSEDRDVQPRFNLGSWQPAEMIATGGRTFRLSGHLIAQDCREISIVPTLGNSQ